MAGESKSENELLRSIDEKLSALLVIALDDYVRSHGVAGARPKPIERLLHDTGMSTAEIATMLGKTQRAVQSAIANRAPAKKAKPKAK